MYKTKSYEIICTKENCYNRSICKSFNNIAIRLNEDFSLEDSDELMDFLIKNKFNHLFLQITEKINFCRVLEISFLITEIKKQLPKTLIEINIPDFKGYLSPIQKIVNANPHIISHDITSFNKSNRTSLKILKAIKELNPQIITKSSICIGQGLYDCQVKIIISNLKANYLDILNIGQDLNKSPAIPLERFIELKNFAQKLNFLHVISEPMAKCTYKTLDCFVDF